MRGHSNIAGLRETLIYCVAFWRLTRCPADLLQLLGPPGRCSWASAHTLHVRGHLLGERQCRMHHLHEAQHQAGDTGDNAGVQLDPDLKP